ncbi:MAG: ABC transporter substrate-binding protein [Spirochaetes bacterium]|nr:ABC transporter substrate-binding protein [Spirochaetota bacterium]
MIYLKNKMNFILSLRIKKVLLSLFILIFCLSLSPAKIKVTFINPQTKEDTFWKPVTDFMQAACNDLNMELSVFYADFDHLKMVELVKQAAYGFDQPDFIVIKAYKKQGGRCIQIAQDARVNLFIFNAGLDEEETVRYGTPRSPYSQWIGQMLPDDEQAGYDLAKILIARGKTKQIPIKMIGIGGKHADTPSILRIKGLKRAISDEKGIRFYQTATADWTKSTAMQKFYDLYDRYKDITIGWGANDPTALGMIEVIKKKQLVPGIDFLTGGIDWTKSALQAVKKGEMEVTIGGHFMEGGWVMVLLYDYFHGIDFKSDGLTLSTRMSALTAENINAYLRYFGKQDWTKIDFKKFSKKNNPSLTKYDFSIDAILKQFK